MWLGDSSRGMAGGRKTFNLFQEHSALFVS
jgi:hypothetical protein